MLWNYRDKMRQPLLQTTAQASIPKQTHVTITPTITNTAQLEPQPITAMYTKAVTTHGMQTPTRIQPTNSDLSCHSTPIHTVANIMTTLPAMPIASTIMRSATTAFHRTNCQTTKNNIQLIQQTTRFHATQSNDSTESPTPPPNKIISSSEFKTPHADVVTHTAAVSIQKCCQVCHDPNPTTTHTSYRSLQDGRRGLVICYQCGQKGHTQRKCKVSWKVYCNLCHRHSYNTDACRWYLTNTNNQNPPVFNDNINHPITTPLQQSICSLHSSHYKPYSPQDKIHCWTQPYMQIKG